MGVHAGGERHPIAGLSRYTRGLPSLQRFGSTFRCSYSSFPAAFSEIDPKRGLQQNFIDPRPRIERGSEQAGYCGDSRWLG